MPPRVLSVSTHAVKDDVLLLNGFTGYEAISRPFHFQLQCIAENAKKIRFEDILGQVVTVRVQLPERLPRWITGICSRVAQGGRDRTFTRYLLDIVPEFWFLSRKTHSRIFQHMTVVEILHEVLKFKYTGLVIAWQDTRPLEPREYCVQYRESDFAFASRLMEEVGLRYFFKHDYDTPMMDVTNSPGFDQLTPTSTLKYDPVRGGTRPESRILSWEKSMELKSKKVTLWDHCFELPHKHLEAFWDLQDPVKAGKSTHYLHTASNLGLDLFDYPGGYAKRFDGISKSGAEQPERLKKIFEDNRSMAELRMQEEAAASILVSGSSNVRHLVSGHQFALDRHFEGDGDWILYEIEHVASESANARSDRGGFTYQNHFTCFPKDLPFVPPRITPRPLISGTQTAVVVGPPGEEIFTDKYGRVKVQFHWDGDGKHDVDSSCWIRVGQPIAGRRWGASFWPRIGQEVIVDFLEGDPDRPIIIGCVYNADQMPPYLGGGPDPKHKNDNRLMGIKSSTTLGGEGFNEWRFDDTKGKEQLFLHAARNMDVRVKSNSMESVGGSKHVTVGGEKEDGTTYGDYNEWVFHDANQTILHDLDQDVGGHLSLEIGSRGEGDGGCLLHVHGHRVTRIEKSDLVHVKENLQEKVDGNQSLEVGGKRHEKVGNVYTLDAGEEIHLKSGQKIVVEAGTQLSLKVGGNFIDISPAGVAISGTMVLINSGGAPASGTASEPPQFTLPEPVAPDGPASADDARTGFKSSPS